MSWNREHVRDKVMAILKPHAQNGDQELTGKSHLVADLGIDSLGVMEVLAELEDEFKLTIPDEALREVDTIDDVSRAIEARLEKDGRLQG